jgi:simple sugar transport system ATP-binding protein
VENFTVLDNIILGAEPQKGLFINREEARKKIKALSEQYKLAIDPDVTVENISVGMQQRVEILKMLFRENEILIFDEPTAVLTPQEIDELMQIMRNLVKEGKSILFITHKLNEIMAVADTCTVLRKGKKVGSVKISETTKEELSRMMVGRVVEFTYDKKPVNPGKVVFETEGLTVVSELSKKKLVDDVSFQIREGEIVCIAGIEGNGQSELVYAISGLIKPQSGTIRLKGEDITHKSIRYRNDLGISHIPEDRHKHGLILDYNLAYNLILKKYHTSQFHKWGFLKKDDITNYANDLIGLFDIRSGQGAATKVRSMSGGNQQKAIVARELSLDSPLLLAVQPTRGLDVGAIEYIHKAMLRERDKGRAVLLVSLELDEVFAISDRILVIYEGKIVKELDPKTTTHEEIGLYMAGVHKGDHHEQ